MIDKRLRTPQPWEVELAEKREAYYHSPGMIEAREKREALNPPATYATRGDVAELRRAVADLEDTLAKTSHLPTFAATVRDMLESARAELGRIEREPSRSRWR